MARPDDQAAYVTEVDLVVFALGLGLLIIEMKGASSRSMMPPGLGHPLMPKAVPTRNNDPTKPLLASQSIIREFPEGPWLDAR